MFSFVEEVTNVGKVDQEKISEFYFTLQNLSPSLLQAVMHEESFIKQVPYGSIENPAAYVHSMVKRTTQRDVEKKILGCIL